LYKQNDKEQGVGVYEKGERGMKHIWEHKSDNTVYTYLGKSVDFYKYNLLPLPELDGNLMVEAINKMMSIKDEDEYTDFYSFEEYAKSKINEFEVDFNSALFGSPETFFRLMQECLDKGVIG
jgi:hypothetical protein